MSCQLAIDFDAPDWRTADVEAFLGAWEGPMDDETNRTDDEGADELTDEERALVEFLTGVADPPESWGNPDAD